MPVPKKTFLDALEKLAPASLAESWDNCGLLVDAGNKSYSRVLLALDATEAVAREAVERDCDLLLTHHPILLKGIRRISQSDPQSRFISILLRAGVSHFAAHTNLDSAKGGVNAVLAKKLGLSDVRVLQQSPLSAKKIVVYVPPQDADSVFNAMCAAGAGSIGRYAQCGFRAEGEGTFLPLEGAHPVLGSVGSLERAREIRLETIVPVQKIRAVLAALLAAHPYEEPAFDVYSLELDRRDEGFGRIGTLRDPQPFGAFAQAVKRTLRASGVRTVGDREKLVKTVAVCGGSGADLIDTAIAAKVDVLVTGDVKHHQALFALENGLLVVDAGHFETEAPIIDELFECLQEQFDQVQYEIEFMVSRAGVSAMQSI